MSMASVKYKYIEQPENVSSYSEFRELSLMYSERLRLSKIKSSKLRDLQKVKEQQIHDCIRIKEETKRQIEKRRIDRRIALRKLEKISEDQDYQLRKFTGTLTPAEKLMQRVNTWRGLRMTGISISILYTIISLSILL